MEAVKIPGVLMYSMSYFCLKFASYGLLLWLPMFLKKLVHYTDYETATAVSIYDIGNIVGSVLLGYLTDLTYSRRTPLAVLSIVLATIVDVLLILIQPHMKAALYCHVFFLGVLIGGITAIISGIASADLGKQSQLKSNTRSLGTVVGIVWGIGTLGASLGQVLIGITE